MQVELKPPQPLLKEVVVLVMINTFFIQISGDLKISKLIYFLYACVYGDDNTWSMERKTKGFTHEKVDAKKENIHNWAQSPEQLITILWNQGFNLALKKWVYSTLIGEWFVHQKSVAGTAQKMTDIWN